MNDQKPELLTDLAKSGASVDLYVRSSTGQEVLKNVKVVYVKRDWVGTLHRYRGILHALHLPRESIVKIDRRTRIRRRH